MKVSVESRHVPGLTGGVAGFLCGIRVCEWVYGVLTVAKFVISKKAVYRRFTVPIELLATVRISKCLN